MSLINWVANKTNCIKDYESFLNESIEKNHFTNNGPCVKKLESYLTKLFEIPNDKVLVLTNNGASALHALVSAIDFEKQKQINYAIQSFNFPCAAQGPLSKRKTVIIDINEITGTLDLNKIPKDNTIDGIIVTNPFGNCGQLSEYDEWKKEDENNRVVIYDNAASCFSFYKNKSILHYGDGCIVSLHHTKPIGFGEGGIAIMNKKYEESFRCMINFGYNLKTMTQEWLPDASNYKMSDISASFIFSYIEKNFEIIKNKHKEIYKFWESNLKSIKELSLYPNKGEIVISSCIPILYNKEIELNQDFIDIGARKYYKPLEKENCDISVNLYNRIVCLPCHVDLTKEQLQKMLEVILKYI